VSKETARTLRDFCREVVDYGTGMAAGVDLFSVSGKTGTGQKASRRGGYLAGKFVSSFVGFAPHNDPRVACLVLLDEPRWRSRYGGESAAPVFARLCRSLANGTEIFDGAVASEPIRSQSATRTRFSAPNFLRMERADALDRARRLGANVLCQGDGGRVVSQYPAPGVAMDKDDVIRLQVAQGRGKASANRIAPDLRGLTMREARRRAAQYGFRARFVGNGIVKRQSPIPGKKTGQPVVKLYCDSSVGGGVGRSGGSR
jgi:stage V sporulation protein D (sporulation-specific penicillin-binding protein)